MKILAQDNQYEIRGFKPWAHRNGYKWISWDEQKVAAFDVFYDVQPDVYIGPYPHSVSVQRCLEKYPKTKVIEVSDYYMYSLPSIHKSFIYDFLIDSHVWYIEQTPLEQFKCDIGCCDVLPSQLIYRAALQLDVKVLGTIPWLFPQYLGLCSVFEQRMLYNAAHLVYVSNKQEEAKALGCGAVTISDLLMSQYTKYVDKVEDIIKLFGKPADYSVTELAQFTYDSKADEIWGEIL